MRKQDRIANEEQSRPQDTSRTGSQPEPRKTEQLKGSASETHPRPPRPSGKLPLPD
jgi:hypothetical protein